MALHRGRIDLLDVHLRREPGLLSRPFGHKRSSIITLLRDLGAGDVAFAFDRACLQGQIGTAKLLQSMGASPARGSVMGPCETQNADGLTFLLDLGAEIADAHGSRLAPVLGTYCRNPNGKHR